MKSAGEPLLRWVLTNRSWFLSGQVKSSDYVFVLFDTSNTRVFVEEKLKIWFPECRVVFTQSYTRGGSLFGADGYSRNIK